MDEGLKICAKQIGIENSTPCQNCNNTNGFKLSKNHIEKLAYIFFVEGSFNRTEYGGSPVLAVNHYQSSTFKPPANLKNDLTLIERITGLGIFHYGPPLWKVGLNIEPLDLLLNPETRESIINRVLKEYPVRIISETDSFYRIRKDPKSPLDHLQYDSPPDDFLGSNRLDSPQIPNLYGSSDLQTCLHECRVSSEDNLFLATLTPLRPMRFLNLNLLLQKEEYITPFESLDMAIHLIFLAGKHSYEITRAIAKRAYDADLDGIIYPSYFSTLRLGFMPFQSTFGLSNRSIPILQKYEEAKSIPNIAVFGRPITEQKIKVKSLNRLHLKKVDYHCNLGPVVF